MQLELDRLGSGFSAKSEFSGTTDPFRGIGFVDAGINTQTMLVQSALAGKNCRADQRMIVSYAFASGCGNCLAEFRQQFRPVSYLFTDQTEITNRLLKTAVACPFTNP